ncbi:Cupredoxin [Talaromyces proteolyticus]|uniref:Cupredoxin n=1 Tax=Talaromyces proteolyticus TaxID=1131652 RepID=A0AAD4L0L3_9EURO|nr:Cupredoxin [Talaromyces proteolyticus]KAH8701670.1 Cupredoxin [Talaromyces proteolyticus]
MLDLMLSIFMFSFISAAAAQYGNGGDTTAAETSTKASPSSTTSASPAVQTVEVGQNGLSFSPDTLTISPGGKIEFHFNPGNHTVAQASFSNPCNPMSDTSLFSGFVPGSSTRDSSSIFTVTVNDTNPIWYYCGQVEHCQTGMVGVINPPASGPDTLAAFKSAAANIQKFSVPVSVQGGVFGVSAASASSSTIASNSPSSTSTSTTSPTQTGAAPILSARTYMSFISILSLFKVLFIM